MDVEGKVIFFNKDFHTLYIGYMHDGKRQGWGIEIPLRNTDFRLPFIGMWEEDMKVYEDAEKDREIRMNTLKNNLNSELLKIIKNLKLQNMKAVVKYICKTPNDM